MEPVEASLSLSPADRILEPFHTFRTLVIPGALVSPLCLHPIGLHRRPQSLLTPSLQPCPAPMAGSTYLCGLRQDQCQGIHLAALA